MRTFTEEEKCILDMYRDKTRLGAVAKMYEALPYIEQDGIYNVGPEQDGIRTLVEGTIDKLVRMSDRRYRAALRSRSYLVLLSREYAKKEANG